MLSKNFMGKILILFLLLTTSLLPLQNDFALNQKSNLSQGVTIITTKNQEVYDGSYALVIGASQYTNGWRDLPGVKTDTELVSQALQKQGFKVQLVMNPTFVQFNEAISNFIGDYGISPRNRLLIYFAGHSHTPTILDKPSKIGYIVPSDASKLTNNYGEFIKKAISVKRIEAYAQEIQSNHVMFIFDTCFFGSLFRNSTSISATISNELTKPVRQFILAGNENQLVPDDSIFRKQFITGIEGQADLNKDGYVTGSELGYFLQNTVANHSNNQQTPIYGKIDNPDLDQGDFIFGQQVKIHGSFR